MNLKQYQSLSEVNTEEHKLSYFHFLMRVLMFATIGLLVGLVAEKIIVWLQGNQDTDKLVCASYLGLQLLILATIFYTFISFKRYFDDWLWGTFAGSFFALCFFNSQVRLNGNINCLLN